MLTVGEDNWWSFGGPDDASETMAEDSVAAPPFKCDPPEEFAGK